MKIDNHPTKENIIAFLDDPDSSEHKNLELHIATCVDCRKQLNQLSQLQKNIQSSDFIQRQFMHDVATNKSSKFEAALVEGRIEDYVDQKLNGLQHQEIESLVKNETQALKAALHYASHQSAMQREIPTKKINKKNAFDLISLAKKYFTFRTPAWVMVPVTGFASALIVMSMTTQFSASNNSINIASYQDNAVIQYSGKTTQPGIGFFSNAFHKVTPFTNVTISVLEDSSNLNLMIGWPKIDSATKYTMQLKKIVKGQNITLGEHTGSLNKVIFKDIALEKNTRYQWILTGKTSSNETFYTSGGFIRN